MQKVFLIGLACIVLACSSPKEQSDSTRLVFRDIAVIPMDREIVLGHQDVVIADGIIVRLGETGKVDYPDDVTVVDGSGKFLIPGLAEMHAHVPPVDDLEPMKEVLSLFIANGVTTIRGMLGHPRHLELRELISQGEILGPHFYTTGPSFNGNTVKTAEEGAQKVRDQKAAGYDYLKLHPGLTPETFEAIAATAKEEGIPFVGHVSFTVGIQRAIDAGYSSIDHLDGFVEALVPNIEEIGEEGNGLFGIFSSPMADTSRIAKIVEGLRAQGIWMVPTQALAERWMYPEGAATFLAAPEMKYMKQETLDNWGKAKENLLADPRFDSAKVLRYIELRRKLILRCEQNGVGLLLGSDAPQIFNVPGFSVHHELQYMTDAGLTPFEALQAGTINVARYLGKSNQGVVSPGAVADLVVLTDNPLVNISNTKKIDAVVMGKTYLTRDSLDAILNRLAKR